jgi:hypothetical protein
MTDRIHSLTVILDKDYRDDDVKAIVNAIMMIRGVIGVNEHVADLSSRMAEEVAESRMMTKIFELLYPKEDEWQR